MQALRFNPFNQIHKGLRALLYDTALMIQHTNFTREDEIRSVVERVSLVEHLFESHAHIEDSELFPMIALQAPGVVADFEAQHVEDHRLSEALKAQLEKFVETNSPEQNLSYGWELMQQFNAFLAFNVEHMRKEETIVNELLWKHYSDAELLGKVESISASIPPEKNGHYVEWMLKGMATHEIIGWFANVRHNAPPPVFDMLIGMAESVLPAERWSAVRDGLMEGALLA